MFVIISKKVVSAVFSQERLYIIRDLDSFEVATVPLERNTLSGDQEFLEIPGDVVPAHRRPHDELGVAHQSVAALRVAGGGQGALQHLEERMCPLAVHFYLLEDIGKRFKATPRPHMAK